MQDDEQEKQPRFSWTEPMVHAALDEAIQQDCLKERAGQGFKQRQCLQSRLPCKKKLILSLGSG